MSSNITLSAATRQNLLSLQDTANLLATTQNRLSTGKKVNSALDNPVNFFTSRSLDSRSTALSTLLDGISNGIQTIQAANQGITNIQKLTDQLKSTAQQALAAANSFTSKASFTSTAITGATASNLLGGATYTSATASGDVVNDTDTPPAPISGTTVLGSTGNGIGLADGDKLTINGTDIEVVASGATGNQINETDTVADLLTKIDGITGATGSTVDATGFLKINTGTASDLTIAGSAATKLGLSNVASTPRTASGGLSGDLTVTVGTGTTAQTKTITFGANNIKTLDQLNESLADIGAQASLDSTGKLSITTANESGAEDLTLSGTDTVGAGKIFTSGSAQKAVLGGDGKTARDKLVNDYNNLRTQIDQMARDASYNGVNLLNGDTLKVIFNETNTSSLSVKGTALGADSLGVAAVSTTDFQDATSINKVLSQLTSANSTLNSQAATYGSNLSVVQNRQDFTKGLINVLDTGSANLTNADMNAEAANSTALSTRNSLGISALSLANQAQQGVLQLLR